MVLPKRTVSLKLIFILLKVPNSFNERRLTLASISVNKREEVDKKVFWDSFVFHLYYVHYHFSQYIMEILHLDSQSE